MHRSGVRPTRVLVGGSRGVDAWKPPRQERVARLRVDRPGKRESTAFGRVTSTYGICPRPVAALPFPFLLQILLARSCPPFLLRSTINPSRPGPPPHYPTRLVLGLAPRMSPRNSASPPRSSHSPYPSMSRKTPSQPKSTRQQYSGMSSPAFPTPPPYSIFPSSACGACRMRRSAALP